MRKLATKLLVALGLLTSGGAWAQSGTIGITQALDKTPTTVNGTTYKGTYGGIVTNTIDHVTVTLKNGTNCQKASGRNKAMEENNDKYYAPGEVWNKKANTTTAAEAKTAKQYIELDIAVESGWKLDITKLEGLLHVADGITLGWNIEIWNSAGEKLHTSANYETTKTQIATCEDALTDAKFQNLTGTMRVIMYIWQNGSSKYFVTDKFCLQGEVKQDDRKAYAITTSVDGEVGGTVFPSGVSSCVDGGTIQIEAEAKEGYVFKYWLIDGAKKVTTNPYKLENVTEDHTAVAKFEKNPVLTYAKPEGVYCVNRMFPKNVNTVEKGGKITLPTANYIYYKEGYTMTGWNVGGTNYDFGAEVTLNEDVTAAPVFAENTVSLAARSAEVTVTYDFNRNTNGGRLVNIEGSADKVITLITVDGQKIDYMMDADCQTGAGIAKAKGKLNNVGTDGTTAQCNKGTVLTIHDVVKGSVITLTCNADNTFTTETTFNGEAGTLSDSDTKAITYTATAAGDVKVIIGDRNVYLTTVTITYPYVPKEYAFVAEDADFYTLYLDYAVTVPANVTAYTGELNGNNLVLTEINDGYIKAGNAVLIQATAAGTYTFVENTSAEAGNYVGNALKGVLVDTPVSDIEKLGTVLTLGKDSEGKVGFRQPQNTYVSANKAYINYVNPAPGAPAFVRILLAGEVTGIEGVQSVQQKATTNAIYNMMGQRVDANAKGLILMNGKKVIRK